MHSVWVRLNAVFFYGLNVLLGLAVMNWFSCLPQDTGIMTRMPKPVVNKLQMNQLSSLRSHGGVDRALLSFDLDADLRPAYHWNLKQLYCFVLAEYTSNKNVLNQVILWDKIVQAADDDSLAHLQEESTYVKYALVDQATELRNATINLYLMWDHMPITGRLFVERASGSSFQLPGHYF